MKVFLMYKDKDFNTELESADVIQDLIEDLELNLVFEAMADGDEFIFDTVKTVILSYETDAQIILYRQGILKDCLKNSDIVRNLYNIAVESIENRRKHHLGIFTMTPSSILGGAVSLLQMFMGELRKLREIAEHHSEKFASEGFIQFFSILKRELSDDFFTSAEKLLEELKFDDGIIIRANLTKGNEGSNYTLVRGTKQGWLGKIFSKLPLNNGTSYSFRLHPRDDSGFSALANIKNRATNPVSNMLAQSAEHVLNFFAKLRKELAFYIGALNLYEKLKEIKEPISFPSITDINQITFRELYDLGLTLSMHKKVVGNDLEGDSSSVVIITGANQGGKSTFLRSVGIAHLLMQSGMFVPAEEFSANPCSGIFTHFGREEDKTMESGRLDEELKRMSKIVDRLKPGSLMLFNESFSSTNEREGSEIARQITMALTEAGVKIFFVTHLYEFANKLYNDSRSDVLFLVAERKEDGTRTFRIVKGAPAATVHGKDLYEKIFSQ